MTLNGVMVVTLRYFTEFGKPALQKTMCGGIYARDLYCVGGTLSLTQSIYCIFSECTMSSQRKFTFAISSPDEFLVSFGVLRRWGQCPVQSSLGQIGKVDRLKCIFYCFLMQNVCNINSRILQQSEKFIYLGIF